MNRTIQFILFLTAILCLYIYSKVSDKPPYGKRYTIDSVSYSDAATIQAEAMQHNYEQAIQYYIIQNNGLTEEVQQTKKALQQSKENSLVLQSKISTLSQRLRSSKDTVIKILYCDSLDNQVGSLLAETALKDCLYDSTITHMQTIILNKDSILDICQQSHSDISALLDTSLQEQKKMEEELASCKKKLRHRTALNNTLIGALGAITTTFLLIHKP